MTTPNMSIPERVVTLLSSFQGLYFGIDDKSIAFELGAGLSSGDVDLACRVAARYRPVAEKIVAGIDKYVNSDGITLGPNSLDLPRIISDFRREYADIDPELLTIIARNVYYWKVLR